MDIKKVVRCSNHKTHNGNILAVVDKGAVYIKCPDRGCRRWTKITLNLPGLNIDLRDAGIMQQVMPENYHLTLEPATTVVNT